MKCVNLILQCTKLSNTDYITITSYLVYSTCSSRVDNVGTGPDNEYSS